MNIKRYKLWEELNPDDESERLCVYTGVRITFQMAMSEQTHIDHVIPRSRSLDNSLSNLLLCTARQSGEGQSHAVRNMGS